MRRVCRSSDRFRATGRWWMLAVSVWLASVSVAETVRLGSLPRKVVPAGFAMVAETEVVSGYGYQPIHLTFSPLGKAFRRDRHLQVVIEPGNMARTELDFSLRHAITIPEGSAAVEVPVYVPHYVPWESIHFEIYEEGRLIDTGKQTFYLGSGLRTRFAEQLTTVGILSADDMDVQDAAWKVYPDVRTLVTVLGAGPIPENAEVARLNHKVAFTLANQVQPAWVQFRPLDERKLHDVWLGYSQLDVIIVAAPVLDRIAKQQPDKIEPLRRWIAAGGNLWVYACGQKTSITALEGFESQTVDPKKILAAGKLRSRLNLTVKNDTSKLMHDSWNGVQKESTQYSYRGIDQTDRSDVFQELGKQKHPFAVTVPKKEIAGDLRIGSFGLGTVMMIGSDDPFPGSFQYWSSVVDLQGEGQVIWTERMGIDVSSGNDNYWTWLIPSVGQPPVKSFVFLNAMFVVLVGPVCYFFFRRRQRLYLLYFVAPFMAFLCTASLFAYAVAADGTKTKLRSRQITWVDSSSGYVVDQSRQTYYAVFGSQAGITLSADTAVYPVRSSPAFNRYNQRYGRSARRGQISVTKKELHLSGTFFPPRHQVQYLMTLPQRQDQPIRFTLSPEALTVAHQLPYTLRRILARDQKGGYWQAENVAPGSSVTLTASDGKVLKELLDSNVLPPLGTVPMLQGNRRVLGNVAGVEVSSLDQRLQAWSTRLPPGNFVATADLIDDALGVDNAVVLDSVHVVMGVIP